MMRQGPIPLFIHGILEYGMGVLLIVAPFLFGFDSSAATAVAIVSGVATFIIGGSTDSPTGLAKVLTVGVHMVLDLVIAVIWIASPFLFGFTDDRAATAFFIVLGIAGLLLTIGTRFLPGRSEARAT